MTPEQRISRTKKLVASARAVLSGNIGITVGVFRLRNNFDWLDKKLFDEFPVFEEYASKIPTEVPVGSARLEWNLSSLMKNDHILKELEYEYRERVFKACIEIIEKFS